MAQSHVCSVFLVLLLTAVRTSGEFVPLGNSVKLQSDQNCSDGELKLDRRLKDDQPMEVARRVHGVWLPAESYKGRVENDSSAGILLKHVNFNDMGWYEFTCNGSSSFLISVKVVQITEVSMSVEEAVTLPCHSSTNDEPVKFIRWQRGAERVLEMNVSSGNTTYGTGLEGRVSLSSEWRSHGNLSLTVMRTGPEDGRLYSCFVGYESGNREMENPAVVRVSPQNSTEEKDRIQVLLGESATFPATRNCSKENAELIHRSCDKCTRPVARYQDGAWSPEPDYKNRVDQGDTVTLNNTNINDSGLYELTCNETATELDVVPFHVVQAAEGQTVTLQCHHVTTNKTVECAWWEKDGKRVFGTNFSSCEIKPEAGFEGRVSLADEALKRGNFSVTVRQVRQEDGGVYRCYVQVDGKKERGIPAATRLTVNEEKLGSYRRRWDRTGDAGIVQETLGSYMLQKEQKGFSLYRGDRENRGRPGSHSGMMLLK
ncbi:uncharacterized protein LOC111649016 [Seriola lalandi dorsalis]|uniref:uncharacterized protein LOC111649016 n=1 Tax=Seriola lalandi dorsalis TaxID=1841481 RepID=UPI000C6FB056|nr:uncharacterized protein LOC111649016 [Seriola lalandi dorsalis]